MDEEKLLLYLTDLCSQFVCLILCQETDIITQNDADDNHELSYTTSTVP